MSDSSAQLELSPTPAVAFARLQETVLAASVTLFLGEAGSGKTTLIQRLQNLLGGARISCQDMMETQPAGGQPAVEETLHGLIGKALEQSTAVYVEDIDLVCNTNRMANAYPRPFYFQVALQALFETARARGAKLVLTASSREPLPPRMDARLLSVGIGALDAADYRFFLDKSLGEERARNLDARRIFSFAPKLSIYQLREACALLSGRATITNEMLMELIDTRVMTSNVALGEVSGAGFADLKGFRSIVEALETFVVNPMLFDSRLEALHLSPKRGVLLYGPPGTGKTSVGRALAHRLKGKFFMIDGTFVSDLPLSFYNRVRQTFEQAKHNTPSVIFIDDADVLMQSDLVHGFNRLLLTLLDGLETKTSGNVTVIITAMDPNRVPQPLLRSGRIELWLETKLPLPHVRAEILEAALSGLPRILSLYDAGRIIPLTEGFNAADMKRLAADAKALYASCLLQGGEPGTMDDYLQTAAEALRRNKELLAAAQEGKLTTSEVIKDYYGAASIGVCPPHPNRC